MKFSGKMCLKITLKVTKNQGFSLSLEDTLCEKTHGGQVALPPPPPAPAVLGLISFFTAKTQSSNFYLELYFVIEFPQSTFATKTVTHFTLLVSFCTVINFLMFSQGMEKGL